MSHQNVASTPRLLRALLLLAASMLPAHASAFLFNEHRDVSNEALGRATAYVQGKHKTFLFPVAAQLPSGGTSRYQQGGCPPLQTYGDVVALVDYITNIDEFVSHREAEKKGACSPLLAASYGAKLFNDTLHYIHASHEDNTHFQDRAVSTFMTFHQAAIATARAGDLRLALLYSAYAAHFIEDLFAPGHLLTPKGFLPDVMAMTFHDDFNRRGINFWLTCAEGTESAFDELTEFLSPGWSEHFRHHRVIYLRGDGQLHESSAEAEILTAIVARAIADVFEAYIHDSSANHFETTAWHSYEVFDNQLHSPRLALRYGTIDSGTVSPLTFSSVYAVRAGFGGVLNSGGVTFGTASYEFLMGGLPDPGWVILPCTWPRVISLGLSAEGNLAISGRQQTLEALLRVSHPLNDIDALLSAGVGVGWHHDSEGDGGWAPRLAASVRLGLGYSLVYTSLGLGLGYSYDAGRGWIPGIQFTATIEMRSLLRGLRKLSERDRGVPYADASP